MVIPGTGAHCGNLGTKTIWNHLSHLPRPTELYAYGQESVHRLRCALTRGVSRHRMSKLVKRDIMVNDQEDGDHYSQEKSPKPKT